MGEYYLELERLGYTVDIEEWPISQGKGLDDLLASGHKPSVIREG